jgi:hypothetical protein
MIDMFRKKPVLQYESAIESYPDIITPAKAHVPEWYKKIPKWENGEIFTNEKGFQKTLKQCMPFLDSLTTGYMIVLSHDIYVKNNNGIPYLSWQKTKFPPSWRSNVANNELVPFNHYPLEYTWHPSVANVIPLGYSMLFTHPLNRHDLPFTTLSGIIDGGLVTDPTGNIPFYIKKGFEGLIPQGTPIIQIIPFLQQDWTSKKINGLLKKGEHNNEASSSLISGWYKKTFWTRKKYE